MTVNLRFSLGKKKTFRGLQQKITVKKRLKISAVHCIYKLEFLSNSLSLNKVNIADLNYRRFFTILLLYFLF